MPLNEKRIKQLIAKAEELGENCFITINSADIRDLLNERECLKTAIDGLLNALPSATTHPAIKAARAALKMCEENN